VYTSKGKRYTEEFKIEAVQQIIDRVHSVYEVAERPRRTLKFKTPPLIIEKVLRW
jgi:hypothetical protein